MNIKPMVAVDVLAERLAQLEEFAFAGGPLPLEEAPGSPVDEALITLRALVRQAEAVVDGGDWEIAIERIGALLAGTATNLEPRASTSR